MKTRAVTGFFFVIVMIASMLFGHYPFGIFYLLLTVLCLSEFYSLIKQSGAAPNVQTGLLNGVYLYIIFALLVYPGGAVYQKIWFLLPLTLSAVFIQELFKKSPTPFNNIAYTYLGLIFVGMPFIFFHALAYIKGGFNFHYPLAFLVMLWANDTGAYLVGVKFDAPSCLSAIRQKKPGKALLAAYCSP